MLVILATIVACIWYFFALPNATTVVLVCGLTIVLSTIVKRNVKSVLFFLGTVILFFVALSNSILYAALAFFVVLFAAGILFDTSSSEETADERNNDRGFGSERIRGSKRRVANTGYDSTYGHDDNDEVQYDRNNSEFTYTSGKKQSGISDEEYRKKQAEDDAYFYRRHSGYRHKVEEADDVLGRSQRERDYEDDKYEVRCNSCNEPESHCRCCDTCNQYPCRCCRRCDLYPCECCDTCGEASCRCCRRCDSYPCECCDECGQPQSYCRCCRRCDRYPCECCNECGEANCRCCRRCDAYPCECCSSCGQPDRYCKCN
ncbi:hypothetical protein bcere0028_18850 [Bacillus cereus AH1271]|nr:hypothetical protein MLA2C4_10540 [Bacillus mobilis]EEL82428.1 hypothetical protein bcere0028_18850 [Bacillus cereus AH1271]PEU77077.1 hypothetical protein CN386_15260 [Bacillus cereus]PGT76911.1 hypothetical protein COD14_08010 [Bacillus cereus]PGV95604.1 hypothetical protein COD86_12075 [Bacillus cereus]